VLGVANPDELDAAKAAFEDSLTTFCEATDPMNKEFLGHVLHLLDDIVRKSDERAQKRPARRGTKPGKQAGKE